MRIAITAVATCALALVAGCQKADDSVAEKLERIDQRTAKMEKQLAALSSGRAGAAARGPAQKRERPRPDARLTYSIPVEGAPVTGAAAAPVTIVEGFEFACGWCEKSRSLVKEVLDEYGDKVRLVHKSYLVHPDVARVPALAACAANKQGRFAAMETLIWDKGFKARKLDKDHMLALADEAGVDRARFEKDMEGSECAAQLQRDQRELAAVGVSGTPAFFINGRWLPQRSKAGFKQLIDEELAKAEKTIASGTKPENYYAEHIVEKGKKRL